MKKLMTGIVAAMAMGVMAANTVKVTKFHQSYPYSGKATVNYTVGGALPAKAVEFILNTDDASGYYWSSTSSSNTMGALDFYFSLGGFGRGQYIRYNGIPVRPVRDSAP